MGDVVNLRRARKERVRAGKETVAEANRLAFGRTKTERALSDAERDLAARRLEGHRREITPEISSTSPADKDDR